MNTNNLILVGGGGHCKAVIDVIENTSWSILGILDTEENIGKRVLEFNVIGTDEKMQDFIHDACFLITVGQINNVELRIKLHEKLLGLNGKFATVIAHDSHVSKYASIGIGTAVMHKAVVNASAKIGVGCIINTLANVEHDSIIEDYCHISTGAMINGSCTIGQKTFIGSGAVIYHGVSIVENCIIAAGSVVRKNITKSGVYAGNPARSYT